MPPKLQWLMQHQYTILLDIQPIKTERDIKYRQCHQIPVPVFIWRFKKADQAYQEVFGNGRCEAHSKHNQWQKQSFQLFTKFPDAPIRSHNTRASHKTTQEHKQKHVKRTNNSIRNIIKLRKSHSINMSHDNLEDS